MAEFSNVGSSRTSTRRSTFLDKRSARFLLASTSFSLALLYVLENLTASLSSFGMALRNSAVLVARAGNAIRRDAWWDADSIMGLYDFFDSDWREMRRVCEACDNDCCSAASREESEPEARWLRYSKELGSAGALAKLALGCEASKS